MQQHYYHLFVLEVKRLRGTKRMQVQQKENPAVTENIVAIHILSTIHYYVQYFS